MRARIDEELLKAMWLTHPMREIALAMGCSASHVGKRAAILGLPKRRAGARSGQAFGHRVPDPTPAEVAEGAAAMQSKWSKLRRKSRAVVKTPEVPIRTMKIR